MTVDCELCRFCGSRVARPYTLADLCGEGLACPLKS
jgi:hypothetical protein